MNSMNNYFSSFFRILGRLGGGKKEPASDIGGRFSIKERDR
jgi:hypothetical protein